MTSKEPSDMTEVERISVAVDVADLRAAFEAHTKDATAFTRRMAIDMGDFFGVRPMSLVWQLEKAGIIKRGSWDWFKSNGGITADHVAEARADRYATGPEANP